MESDSDVEDILSVVNPNESDFLSSGDEYFPEDDTGSDSVMEMPSTSKKRRIQLNRRKREQSEDSSSDDDIPSSRIQEEAGQCAETARKEEEQLLTQIFDEPMWSQIPFQAADVPFCGPTEAPVEELKTPYQFFKDLITDEMLEKLADETNMYALSVSGLELRTTQKEIETFIAIYLRMGIMKARSVRAYWATPSRYPPVADTMVRNRFELLCHHIHFVNNDTHDDIVNNDRLWKIRPWIDDLTTNLKKIVPSEHQCVGDIMVSFKGRCSLKQYIRNKPHKWGFKLWARAGSEGILHDFEVYQGSSGAPRSEKGMGGDVVMDMVKNLEDGKNYKIFADNFFSSVYLVKQLKDRGMWYVGTIRENRLKGCKLMPEKELAKQGRGAMHSLVDSDSNIIVVRWFDSKKVDIISSYVGTEPVENVTRWDKKLKKKTRIKCPAVIHCYNKHMGGVDLLDSLTALYKAKIKTQRWYMYLFYHTINMIVVTSWLRYRLHCRLLQQPQVKLCDFQEMVAGSLAMVERSPRHPAAGSPQLLPGSRTQERHPTVDTRLDRVDHLPHYGERQWCKHPRCHQKSFLFCIKCNVHLCLNKDRNCFEEYHTKRTL